MLKSFLSWSLVALTVCAPHAARANTSDVDAIMAAVGQAYPKLEAVCAGDSYTRDGAISEAMASLGRPLQGQPDTVKRAARKRLDERCGAGVKAR